ncbi:hypothetical protein CK203_023405 [Vitis vinifera]|uniref:Uncharacterized protein n=1 Tax=Vitis vinifera TaxID=29760 RepID=A0A438J6K7_VITVI|nr:hypothetical protein CK203_023405 [Vitis vinifera]
MFEGVVRSLGAGRFLDWRALDASGLAGGVLICWDQKISGNFGLGGGPILNLLDVFGRLECNKSAALQQVEYWDQVEKEQEVRTGIADAFQQLLTEDSEWKANIGGLNLNQISQQEVEILEFPFSEDEVHSALMDMNGTRLQDRMASLWPFGNAAGSS